MTTKSFKPSNLEKRYNTYYAILVVPKDVRYVIGKSKFFKSTETDNLKLAESIAKVYVMGWKAEIASVRSKSDEPIIQSAKEIKQLLKSSPSYLVQDVIQEEFNKLMNAQKPLHAEVFERIATGKNRHLDELKITWQKHEEDRGLVRKTIDQMSNDVELLVKQFPTANLLTLENCSLWIKHIAKKGELSASSITRIVGSCRNFYKYLQNIKEVAIAEVNPFIVPNEFKISNKPNSKSINKVQSWIPFEPEEIVSIYKFARITEDNSLADLILIGMHTGARIEEICSLKCSNINLRKNTIRIIDAKTEAGERIIPIHSKIYSKIEELIGDSVDDYLISNQSPNKYGDRSNALGKRFGRLKSQLRFSDRQVFHSIRKTFTTMLENAGISENIAADIVGHEKPRITYGLYSGGASLAIMKTAIEKVKYKLQ